MVSILINERSHPEHLTRGARETELKFAKIVFMFAGIWGILVTLPLYFLYNFISFAYSIRKR
jgi:hypothetical protein